MGGSQVDHGTHPEQRFLPGVLTPKVGTVLVGMAILLLRATHVCAVLVRCGRGAADS
jgi:hypothetical protein